jgi:excisionase family DNA binding protein
MAVVTYSLMSPREVAAYLQVQVSTLYAWRMRGEGPPAIKVGKRLRYRRADVEEWLMRAADEGCQASGQDFA